jgi:hypothetical protein
MPITRERLRLKLDPLRQEQVVDVLTGEAPDFYRAMDLAFEFGVFFNSELQSITNLSSVHLEVKYDSDREGQAIMEASLSSADLNTALTLTQWDDETACHGTFLIDAEDAALPLEGEDSAKFWLVVYAYTTASPSRKITLGAGNITCTASGGGTGTPDATQPVSTYLTVSAGDARYKSISGDGTTIFPVAAGLTPDSGTGSDGDYAIRTDGKLFRKASGAWSVYGTVTGAGQLESYTVAGAPSAASSARQMIWVSNGDGGSPCVAVSDGSSWRRIPLFDAISAS